MKFLLCLIACLFIADSHQDDKTALQLLYNGVFEQAGLPDPTTILDCYDEAAIEYTVSFLDDFVTFLADDYVFMVPKVLSDYQSLMSKEMNCLGQNPEFQTALAKYGMTGKTLHQIKGQVKNYSMSHLYDLHNEGALANTTFKGGDFLAVGQQFGAFLQAAFNVTAQPVDGENPASNSISYDPATVVQQVFDGFWEEASLDDPTTPVPCFDLNSAQLTVDLIAVSTGLLHAGNPLRVTTILDSYLNVLPQPVKDCLGGDTQVQQVIQAYDLADLSIAQFKEDLLFFFLLNTTEALKTSADADNNYLSGNYKGAGEGIGILAKEMYANSTIFM